MINVSEEIVKFAAIAVIAGIIWANLKFAAVTHIREFC